MLDQTSNVGPLTIPLPPEGIHAPISDPTITGLLDWFRFWIVDALLQKIEEPNDTQPDPLPAANLFDYDPMDNWVRNTNASGEKAIPALYLWQSAPSVVQDYSMIYDMRIRKLRLMYVAQPIFGPEGTPMFSGLGSAVDAILAKSYSRRYHHDYAYNGDPLGTPIATSLNLLAWKYEGGHPGVMAPIPSTSPRVGGPSGGNVVDYYPALLGSVTVWERIYDEVATAGMVSDIPFGINVNDPSDVNGPLRVMDRHLISASEADDDGE